MESKKDTHDFSFELPKHPKPYTVEHEYGRMQCIDHTYRGIVFQQLEMTSVVLEAVGELLIESDIFSAVQSTADGTLNLDAGMVMSHLIRKRLMNSFLCIVLTRDGALCTENDFKGKANEYIKFVGEVFSAFFTLNPAALQTIGTALIAVLGTAAGGAQLISLLLAGTNSSGVQPNTAQKRGK